jgi:TPR repeat protein
VRWNCKMALTSTLRAAAENVRAKVGSCKRRPWVSTAFPRTLLAIVISTFSSTIALSGFDEGVADYRVGNYKDAFKEWTEAAQQGDVDAQYNLGCLYVRGEGVPQNRALAIEWFQRAADQDELDATTWLFNANPQSDDSRKRFFSKKLKSSGKFHITFVAQRSDGLAMRWPCATDQKDGALIEFKIGVMYENGGMGLPQDDKQAAEWYRRASERNFADAQTKLAYLYAAGRGVEQSQVEAGRLFRRAAEQGNATAQANLGAIYFAKDMIIAYVLISHAADAGNKLALSSLPELKAHLSPDQLLEGQRLAEKWKGNVQWPPEIAERLGSPN